MKEGRVMNNLAQLLMEYMNQYHKLWVEADNPAPMTAQAYMRARLMNDLDGAINEVMLYAETNGGM